MRLFIAINFPGEIKAAIAKISNGLKKAALRGNFSVDENLHLTLVFLGECDVRQAEAVKEVMNDTIFSEFSLMLDKTGFFKRDGGDTWWIGLKDNKLLSDLQADLSERLKQKGFILENRKYRPHATIGREVKMRSGFVQPKVPQVGFNITSIELMKSERINGKLIYTRVYSKNSLSWRR
jgi:2'-5' RNA ligase